MSEVERPDSSVLAAVGDHARDAVLITEAAPLGEAEGGPAIVYINEAFGRMTGYTENQVLGRTPRFLQCSDTDRAALDRIRRALQEDRSCQEELLNVRADGSRFWVEISISPIRRVDGRVSHYLSIQRESTERRAQRTMVDRRLSAARRYLTSAFDEAPTGMAITTPTGRFLSVNGALTRLLDRDAADIVGKDLADLTHPDDLPAGLAACQRLQTDPQEVTHVECRLRRPDGHHIRAQITASAVTNDDGAASHLVMHLQDVTEAANLRAELSHRALHDELTGLPNRTLFVDRLEQAFARSRRDGSTIGLLFCDLDGFKDVNDTLGHEAGDQVLRTLADRLTALVRPGDTVGRMGGDEFTVLCEQASLGETQRVADRLATAAQLPFRYDGSETILSVSIGVAIAGDGTDDVASLLRNADMAMYEAKAEGRGRQSTFHDGMRRRVVARHTLEQELRHALERDEFELHYQPLVDLGTGESRGCEALLRWRQPERGLLSPAAFLAAATDAGLLGPITRWVLAEAAAQTARWQAAGQPVLTTWVNVAAPEVTMGLVEELTVLLDHDRLPAGAVGIEVTESLLMGDLGAVRPVIEELGTLGVPVAIDDFGTGYSSLAYLARLPVAVVKVDRGFTAQLGDADGHGAAVISAVLALGESLGLVVTVEGVETPDQAEILRKLGADTGQGYLLGRPAPPDDRRYPRAEP